MDNATLLPTNKIVPNPDQPRKVRGNPNPTLMDSIRRLGVLQPIVVRPLEDGRYMIISGERRYRAAVALGMKENPKQLQGPQWRYLSPEEFQKVLTAFEAPDQLETWIREGALELKGWEESTQIHRSRRKLD